MSTESTSLLLQASRWLVWKLVQVWPADSARWGQALAAEAEEIQDPFDGVRWALGGVIVFSRALGSHFLSWLKLPAGVGLKQNGGPLTTGPAPRLPRIVTLALLVGAAVLLSIPAGREALITVRATWGGYMDVSTDEWGIDRLAAKAERENDARTLAFAALATRDATRSTNRLERAVAMDPSLAWTYAARITWIDRNEINPHPEWLEKLQAEDPENAVPYLWAADAMARQCCDAVRGGRSFKETELREQLSSNVEWVKLMDRAFSAPRYDSYIQKHWELNREVWSRNPQLSLFTVLSPMWAHNIPNPLHARTYAKILIAEAQSERAARHLDRAEELLRKADAFGKRMDHPNSSDIEQIVGLNISRLALPELASLYQTTGRPGESQEASQRLVIVSADLKSPHYFDSRPNTPNQRALKRDAWIVQGSAALGAILVGGALFSFLLLELWPSRWKLAGRRAICWTADWAPALFLLASVTFLLAFQPYERLLTGLRATSSAADLWLITDAAWSLVSIPIAVLSPSSDVARWTLLIAFPSLLLVFVVVRSGYRSRHTAATAA